MKILSFIFILFFSTTSFAEIINLKCIIKSQDTLYLDNLDDREPIYYDINTEDTTSVITDKQIGYYGTSKIVDTYFLSYDIINRYDGSQIMRTVTVPKSVSSIFKNLKNKYQADDIRNHIKTVDKFFYSHKINSKKYSTSDEIYVEEKSECISLKKKF